MLMIKGKEMEDTRLIDIITPLFVETDGLGIWQLLRREHQNE
jgi:hypothetical protein